MLKEYNILLPDVPKYATQNGSIFYLVCKDIEKRNALISHLKQKGIQAVFHYQSLHKSPFYKNKHDGRHLPNTDYFTDGLVGLPLYYSLTKKDQEYLVDVIIQFLYDNIIFI